MSQRDSSKKEGGGRKGVFFWTGPKTDFEVFLRVKTFLNIVGAIFLKLGSRFLQRKTKVYQGIE